MFHGADTRESFERAAAVVDLIPKGAKPAEIPVEQPTRYHFVVNLKTAKSIGLEIPATLTALADEVVEQDGRSAVHESGNGTFEICRPAATMSAPGSRPEVAVQPSKRRE